MKKPKNKAVTPKSRDVSGGDLTAALAALKYGYNPVVARNLIEYFHTRFCDGDIEQGEIDILLQFVAHAFSKIVDEKYSLDEAFGLKLKRGKYPRQDTFERNLTAAAHMELLIRSGMKRVCACEKTAEWLGCSEKTIERAYEQYAVKEFTGGGKEKNFSGSGKVAFVWLTDEVLRSLLPDGALDI